MVAAVGPVWKPLSGRGFVYVFLISEGATTILAAAGSRLFPGGLGCKTLHNYSSGDDDLELESEQ